MYFILKSGIFWFKTKILEHPLERLESFQTKTKNQHSQIFLNRDSHKETQFNMFLSRDICTDSFQFALFGKW